MQRLNKISLLYPLQEQIAQLHLSKRPGRYLSTLSKDKFM